LYPPQEAVPIRGAGMIEPLQDNLIIEPMDESGLLPGHIVLRIILPDRPVSNPKFGTVRFVGPDVVSLKPNDTVILPSWNDDEIEVDGKKYIVLAEKNISVRVS